MSNPDVNPDGGCAADGLVALVYWLIAILTAPGFIVASFIEDTLKLPSWLGCILGLTTIVAWCGFLLMIAYTILTSALLFFA